jgi:hypothetical protein
MSSENASTPRKPNPNILSEEMRKAKIVSLDRDAWLDGFVARFSAFVQSVTDKK